MDAATDIVVGASATVSGKDAQLATGSHITGKVTGPDGAALAGRERVGLPEDRRLDLLEPGHGQRVDVTNAAGEYDLGGLKAGTYRIGFSTYSGGYLAEYWDDAATVDAATDIVVGASATVSGKNAQLAPGRTSRARSPARTALACRA